MLHSSQVADGLHFLHTEANQVHRALCPHTVFITTMGAWKLGGLSLSSPAFITAETTGVIPVSYRDSSMERFMRYQQACSHKPSSYLLFWLFCWLRFPKVASPCMHQTDGVLSSDAATTLSLHACRR